MNYVPVLLNLVVTSAGPDDDGNPVVCYEVHDNDGNILLSLQSTIEDVAIFNRHGRWIEAVQRPRGEVTA